MNHFQMACLYISIAVGCVFMFIGELITDHIINLFHPILIAIIIYLLFKYFKDGLDELVNAIKMKYRK